MRKHIQILIASLFVLSLTGCYSSKPLVSSIQDREKAAMQLGISLNKKDYLPFFITATQWLGVPYRSGGSSKKGVDCSGFVFCFYQDVFNITLSRSSKDMYSDNCSTIRKNKLEPGDLVFFSTGRGRKFNHVGVYLNDHKFIHASRTK